MFAQHVHAAGALADAARLEVLAVDIGHARSANGLRPRRGPVLACIFLRQSRRLVLAGRLPLLGAFRIAFPLKW
jgi:hypothetical protein